MLEHEKTVLDNVEIEKDEDSEEDFLLEPRIKVAQILPKKSNVRAFLFNSKTYALSFWIPITISNTIKIITGFQNMYL